MRKLIVVVGPTASGKSDLAVQLAKKFNGEVVSADSRQVYKGLTIGSGKITKKERQNIPHHLLDVASPKKYFTVANYKKLALKAIKNTQKRGKLPILAGGSPFYIYSAVDGWKIPEVKPNLTLRKKLSKLSTERLFAKLQKLDSRRAKTLRQSSGQAKNPARLIRALEIVLTTKKPVPEFKKQPLPYSVLFLGIRKSRNELEKLIAKRLEKRFKQGMTAEVKKLHKQGLSWRRLEEFGLEYRFIALYLQGKLSFKEMKEKLLRAILNFSRRQMTWFKKDRRIHWLSSEKQACLEIKRSFNF